jgi:hypothetical protein
MLKQFGLVALASLTLASMAHANRIVVNNDEWTFSSTGYTPGSNGFTNGNDGAFFAINVANWLTAGTSVGLVNRTILNLSPSYLQSGTLNGILSAGGYNTTFASGAGLTLADLQAYDAVFLGGAAFDNAVLTSYVNGGGNVYLMGGTGALDDEGAWDPFLHSFGLDFGPNYNGLGSPYTNTAMSIPVSGTHPILSGVDHLYMGNGNTVYDINASDTRGQVVASYNGIGLIGVYDGNTATNPGAVPEPGTLGLMGLGLAALVGAARRRK